MSAVVFAFSARKSEPRPWQNDELAEFYRVIDMLGRAGLGVVPDMGVSDEGDPWFAFCRADTGDVVVHCARIDGVCVASSIATTEVFRGTSIRDVVNAIIRGRQAALVVASSADGRVYLHPTVVLTAFIAAALLFSNQASAHDLHYLHSDGSGTVSELPVTLTKFIAALREIVHEAVGPVTTSLPNVDQTPTGELEPEPFSLAALLSAAMTVIAPVILGSEGFFDSNLPAASLSNPADTAHSAFDGSVAAVREWRPRHDDTAVDRSIVVDVGYLLGLAQDTRFYSWLRESARFPDRHRARCPPQRRGSLVFIGIRKFHAEFRHSCPGSAVP